MLALRLRHQATLNDLIVAHARSQLHASLIAVTYVTIPLVSRLELGAKGGACIGCRRTLSRWSSLHTAASRAALVAPLAVTTSASPQAHIADAVKPPERMPIGEAEHSMIRILAAAIAGSTAAASAAEAVHCISPELWPQAVARLRRRLAAAPADLFGGDVTRAAAFFTDARRFFADGAAAGGEATPSLATALDAFLVDECVPLVAAAAEEKFGAALTRARALRAASDLRHPHAWFPAARARAPRRIIYHAGPTNSGKTYHALVALKAATSGLYAGPLRLLALEVYESLNLDGCPASLATGQERRDTPFARHVASTVEMAPLAPVDVAVLDEIQMIGDPQRGHAWTRVLLGIPAAELHVCGDAAAVPAVAALAAACGDQLTVRTYARLSPLEVAPASLHADYGRVEAGDCVVAFSRRDIYAIRRTIERKTAHR